MSRVARPVSEMDCQTFDASLLDALYGELDEASSTAMDAHAAGCAACAGRLEKLKRTRVLVRPALEAALPASLEERIVAVATAEMEAPKSNVVSLALRTKRAAEAKESDGTSGGGTVLRFLVKPQLAIAATFLLVLGAAVVFTRSKREASPAAMREASEAVPAAARGGAAPPPAATMTTAEAKPTEPSTLALNDDLSAPAAAAPGPAYAKARARDPAFAAAKSLYDAGRCAEALSKFEALAAHDPEAALYAARCIAKTKGCDAAAARYDDVASRNAGTELASNAALEAARCYKDEGKLAAARRRYVRLGKDSFVGGQANAELASLDTAWRAEPKASKPAATATATARPAKPVKPADAQGF
jgi:hypothetical protein